MNFFYLITAYFVIATPLLIYNVYKLLRFRFEWNIDRINDYMITFYTIPFIKKYKQIHFYKTRKYKRDVRSKREIQHDVILQTSAFWAKLDINIIYITKTHREFYSRLIRIEREGFINIITVKKLKCSHRLRKAYKNLYGASYRGVIPKKQMYKIKFKIK